MQFSPKNSEYFEYTNYSIETDGVSNQNPFTKVFDKYHENLLVLWRYDYPCVENRTDHRLGNIWKGIPMLANFLCSDLHAAYIDITASVCQRSTTNFPFAHYAVHQKQRKFYKELLTEYDAIETAKV